MFRIYHPDGKSIYSPKGLKGENLVSTKFSGLQFLSIAIEIMYRKR